MCGIIALLLASEDDHVNQMLFDGLTVLQHRGQDAAGIVTAESPNHPHHPNRLHLRKDNGLVKDVFQTHHMVELRGNVGLGHVRYPTAGGSSCAEAQPLYTNYPHGICVAHNGNLTNTDELEGLVRDTYSRHINTESDSELLLNIFAESMAVQAKAARSAGRAKTAAGGGVNGGQQDHQDRQEDQQDQEQDQQDDIVQQVFRSITTVLQTCRGGYAGIYLINGIGLVGFRDPHGIRPIVLGSRRSACSAGAGTGTGTGTGNKMDYVLASESVAIDTLGFELVRDVMPGEAIFLDMRSGECHTHQCLSPPPAATSTTTTNNTNTNNTNTTTTTPSLSLSPCIFEYVYFARPDSIMDGVSVYETRLKMGEKLAQKIERLHPSHDIDVVIPIPDTSRTSALQAAYILGRPFREGFIKNRYIARTFIMPGQASRKKSVRLKLNTIKSEFAGRNVLLVDDSIVRGTTAREIVQMARDAGAKKVYFTSAAPPIRYPNIYGIDIPTRQELVAYERNEEQIAKHIGCEWVVYQDLVDLEDSVRSLARVDRPLDQFDCSCFSGEYVTGETIGDSYFERLHEKRNDDAKRLRESSSGGGGKGGGDEGGKGGQGSGKGGNGAAADDALGMSSHHEGCESVNNDTRDATTDGSKGCESL
mmetsp:Transcript_35132/g.76173  ORF Transcript_35132/g.76173 Transcript_35132/m.76173 type:complete len:647 (-) Transcript_35132:289-2229(-)